MNLFIIIISILLAIAVSALIFGFIVYGLECNDKAAGIASHKFTIYR